MISCKGAHFLQGHCPDRLCLPWTDCALNGHFVSKTIGGGIRVTALQRPGDERVSQIEDICDVIDTLSRAPSVYSHMAPGALWHV